MIIEVCVLLSPKSSEMNSDGKKRRENRKTETINTSRSAAYVKAFLFSSELSSDILFIAATGMPEATTAQQTEYMGVTSANTPRPSAPIKRLMKILYKKPVARVSMFAPVRNRVL